MSERYPNNTERYSIGDILEASSYFKAIEKNIYPKISPTLAINIRSKSVQFQAKI
jgi:hypothetical protein